MHIHVVSENGEAKFWLEPQIELAKNYRFSRLELKEIESLIEEYSNDISDGWKNHFGS